MDNDFENNERINYSWFTSMDGLSRYRYTMHGKSDVQIENLIVHVFPDMYYPADKPHMIVRN